MTQSTQDWKLLREYLERGSEPAFARLVSSYVDVVYSAALRQVRRPDLAEEVTQIVFVILARKARELTADVVLAGWLHNTTRYAAANVLRVEARRKAHERKAAQMAINYLRVDSSWEKLSPLLDEGIGRLNEKDRAAIVLRYFQQKSLAETGEALGVSEDAAGMRVSRALAKLREFFLRRGVALPAAALAGVITANSVQAAPPALGASVATHALGAVQGASWGAASVTIADAVCRGIAVAKAKAAAFAVGAAVGVACAGFVVTQYLVLPLWQRQTTAAPASAQPSTERTTSAASPDAVAMLVLAKPGGS
jgi:RNA polymerase sigma factor (sigma-70 family)